MTSVQDNTLMTGKIKVGSKLWDGIMRLGNEHVGIIEGHIHVWLHIINPKSGQCHGKLLKLVYNKKERLKYIFSWYLYSILDNMVYIEKNWGSVSYKSTIWAVSFAIWSHKYKCTSKGGIIENRKYVTCLNSDVFR